MTVELQRIIG